MSIIRWPPNECGRARAQVGDDIADNGCALADGDRVQRGERGIDGHRGDNGHEAALVGDV